MQFVFDVGEHWFSVIARCFPFLVLSALNNLLPRLVVAETELSAMVRQYLVAGIGANPR